MLAALLGALSLFHVTPAQAQTTVWSATLTPTSLPDNEIGCSTTAASLAGRCSSPSGTGNTALTDYEFSYSGTTYRVNRLVVVSGSLVFETNASANVGGLSKLILRVGTAEFPFSEASQPIATAAVWSNSGLSWSVGDTVSLSIVVPPPPPTVTLSASPNPVTEGQSVTVTATLSRALSNAVTIPVTITDNTAESGDHGTLTSITIAAGETTGTGTITTNQDTDYEDETFTVSLDTANLPSSVTAGSPSSVPVTINDLGRTLLTSTLTVKQPVTLHLRGCDSSHGMTGNCDSDALTKDTLTYNGESYRIMRLTGERHIIRHWQIVLGFDKPVPDKMIDVLCLWIDGSRLCLRDALDQNAIIIRRKSGDDDGLEKIPNLYLFVWRPISIGWTVGQQVPLRFSDDGSGTIGGGSGGEGTPGGLPGSSEPPGRLGPPAGSSGSGGGVGASGGPSGPPAGGGGGGGGGLPPSGSSDEPPPEDDELSTLCSQEDRENLERFYETTGGEQWDENENWNSEEPLNQWYGVDTDDEGEVVSLRLSENSLSGDTPEELLSCLSELKELALWGNDLSGEVPEELVLRVERAVLRDIAEMLNINPEWFENYGDPYNFEDWHTGVTTDDDGRVVELVLPGEVPGTLISQLRKLRVITTSSENGGCALSPKDDSSAFSLFLLALLVFAALGRKRARG